MTARRWSALCVALVLLIPGAHADEASATSLRGKQPLVVVAEPAHEGGHEPLDMAETKSDDPASTAAGMAWENLQSDMMGLLRIHKFQWAVSLVMFVLGAVALYSGKLVFKSFAVFFVAAFAYVFSLTLLKDLPNWGIWPARVASVELAIVMGAAAWLGFEGIRIVLGIVVGFFFTQCIHMLFEHFSWPLPVKALIVVSTLMVVLGIWLLSQQCEGQVMGILMSILGANLAVTSIAFFVLFVPFFGNNHFTWNTPIHEMPPWVDMWIMLTMPFSTKNCGIFALTGHNFSIGSHALNLDCILGRLFWILFAILAMSWQWKKESQQKRKKVASNMSFNYFKRGAQQAAEPLLPTQPPQAELQATRQGMLGSTAPAMPAGTTDPAQDPPPKKKCCGCCPRKQS